MKSSAMLKPLVAACLFAVVGVSQGATLRPLDLTIFTGTQLRPGDLVIAPDYLSLVEKATAGAYVEGLVSFNWSGGSWMGVSSFSAGAINVEFPTGFGQPESTYSFTSPYTGYITFSVENSYGDYSGLMITNLLAVPEQSTYAMMLAGLGLVGALARRRQSRA